MTCAAATKAQAAAVKAAGSGTAGAVTTDPQGDGYEVTVTKSDGSTVEIHLDSPTGTPLDSAASNLACPRGRGTSRPAPRGLRSPSLRCISRGSSRACPDSNDRQPRHAPGGGNVKRVRFPPPPLGRSMAKERKNSRCAGERTCACRSSGECSGHRRRAPRGRPWSGKGHRRLSRARGTVFHACASWSRPEHLSQRRRDWRRGSVREIPDGALVSTGHAALHQRQEGWPSK